MVNCTINYECDTMQPSLMRLPTITATSEAYVLLSPGYPSSYGPDFVCGWKFRVESNTGISISCMNVDIAGFSKGDGCGGDRLRIIEANTLTDLSYCGPLIFFSEIFNALPTTPMRFRIKFRSFSRMPKGTGFNCLVQSFSGSK